MTDGRLDDETGGTLSPRSADGYGADPAPRPPWIKEIIAGILLLATDGKGPIPLEKIHAIFLAMKPHEPILSGLRFSLTGAVCFSRDIDRAIGHLDDSGMIEVVDGSVLVEERLPEFVNHLSGFLTNSQIQAVHSASLRFYDRLRRECGDPRRTA
jgi:hypothetical protein